MSNNQELTPFAYDLFEYMYEEHKVTLLENELHTIVELCRPIIVEECKEALLAKCIPTEKNSTGIWTKAITRETILDLDNLVGYPKTMKQ